MYVLLNGAFGVGKTATATGLRRALPGSGIFDPEHPGLALQRLPWNRGRDFQELQSWRRLTAMGVRTVGLFRRIVIVPMAFSELAHLDEVRDGLASSGRTVLHFCLTAPIAVVRARLEARGEPHEDPRWSWVHRRAAECCVAHQHEAFAVRIPTEDVSTESLVEELARRIESRAAMSNGDH